MALERERLAREAERIENPELNPEESEEEEVILPYMRLNLGCHANISDRCFAAHARDNEDASFLDVLPECEPRRRMSDSTVLSHSAFTHTGSSVNTFDYQDTDDDFHVLPKTRGMKRQRRDSDESSNSAVSSTIDYVDESIKIKKTVRIADPVTTDQEPTKQSGSVGPKEPPSYKESQSPLIQAKVRRSTSLSRYQLVP